MALGPLNVAVWRLQEHSLGDLLLLHGGTLLGLLERWALVVVVTAFLILEDLLLRFLTVFPFLLVRLRVEDLRGLARARSGLLAAILYSLGIVNARPSLINLDVVLLLDAFEVGSTIGLDLRFQR